MPRRFETLPCTAVLEQLEAHVDGDLAAAETAVFETHLESCPACAAEHALAVAVRRELRALPELDAPSGVLQEVFREAERSASFAPLRGDAFRGPSVFRRPLSRVRWTRAAAALFAAAVIGAGVWWGSLSPTSLEDPLASADPAVVAQATEEARYALAYLTRVHRRAGLKLRDDLFADRVARPSARGLARSLSPHLGKDAASAEETDLRDRS